MVIVNVEELEFITLSYPLVSTILGSRLAYYVCGSDNGTCSLLDVLNLFPDYSNKLISLDHEKEKR